MDILTNVLFFVAIFLFLIIYWYYKIPKNIPPGPLGIPFVGSLPFVSKKPYLVFIELAKKYGNVFHVYMGSTMVVVLNDFEAIKEAFIKQAEIFSGRPDDPHFKTDANLGIIFNDGEYWRQHRRFLITNLRSNGVGTNALEPRIMNEIHYFINELKQISGKPVKIRSLLYYSLLNNVLLLANNTRYKYDDAKLTNFVESWNSYISLSKSVAIETFFPWISKIYGAEHFIKAKERSYQYHTVLKSVDALIKTSDDSHNTTDTYVKAYMRERSKRLQQNENEPIFSEIGLIHNTRDLLSAGGETSASLLTWIMLYLTKYPKIQIKAQEEIDKTIGRDREVSYNDRHLTPYCESIIMETHRITSFVPLSVSHRTTCDTTLFGYTIPKNTMIFPNIYAVHHDPKLWGDPENFRPERFIGEDGQLIKPEYLIPFSMGKRACAGEPLAKLENYLYLVTFLQHFQLVPTKTYQSLEAIDSIVRQPVSDLICFEQR